MAEAIGVVSGIAGLVTFAAQISKLVVDQYNSLKNAPKTLQDLKDELDILHYALNTIKDRHPNLLITTESPSILERALSECQDILTPLKSRLDTLQEQQSLSSLNKKARRHVKNGGTRIITFYKEDSIQKDVARIHRLVTFFHSAVNTNSTNRLLQLHVDIKDGIEQLKESGDMSNRTLIALIARFDDSIARVLTEREEKYARDRRQALVDWLTPQALDFWNTHKDIIEQSNETAADWIFSHPTFEEWEGRTGSRTLWCHGRPGVGKTVLASRVIEYLRKRPKSIVLWVYCRYNERERQTIGALCRTMLCQLVSQDALTIPKSLLTFSLQPNSIITDSQSQDILCTWMNSLTGVNVVVDALDEYQDDTADNLDVLLTLLVNGNPNGGTFMTSRHPPPRDDFLPLPAKCLPEELQHFLEQNMDEKCHHFKMILRKNPQINMSEIDSHYQELRTQMVENLVNQFLEVESFLQAKLHFKYLLRCRTKAEIVQYISNLPKDLDKIYEASMTRILNYEHEEDCKLACLVLSLTLNFHPALQFDAFSHALACAVRLEANPDVYDPLDWNAILGESDIVQVCAGLIVIEATSQTVQFSHKTVQEYLEKRQISSPGLFPFRGARLALLCVKYFSLDIFAQHAEHYDSIDSGLTRNKRYEGWCQKVLHKYRLIAYIATYWDTLVLPFEEDQSVLDALMLIFHSSHLLVHYVLSRITARSTSKDKLKLHLIAAEVSTNMTMRNLMNICGFSYNLYIAAVYTHRRVAAQLVQEGAEISYLFVLAYKIVPGDVGDILDVVLGSLTAEEQKYEASQALLMTCHWKSIVHSSGARRIRLEASKILLAEYEADVNHMNAIELKPLPRTCLELACAEGNLSMVRLLLLYGADPNAGNNNRKSAFAQACKIRRHSDVSEMLDPASGRVMEPKSKTQRRICILELLIQHGAWHPGHYLAATRYHDRWTINVFCETRKRLIQQGIDIWNARPDPDRTEWRFDSKEFKYYLGNQYSSSDSDYDPFDSESSEETEIISGDESDFD